MVTVIHRDRGTARGTPYLGVLPMLSWKSIYGGPRGPADAGRPRGLCMSTRAPGRMPTLPGTGPLRRAVLAYGLFALVEYAVWLVVILYAFQVSGPGLASVVAVCQLVPAAVIAPLLVGVVGRLPRGTALLVSHAGVALATGLTCLAVLLHAPFVVVLVASTLDTILLATVRPAHYAVLPRLAGDPGELVGANAWCSGVESLMVFAGPALAGLSMAVSGPVLAFAVSTGIAALAVLLCTRLGLERTAAPATGADSLLREATQGLRALRGDRSALALLMLMTLGFVLHGALDVLGVAYAQALGLDESGAGLLVGAVGLGGLAGAVAAPLLGRRRSLAPVVVTAGAVLGAAYALAGVGGSLATGVLVLAVSGIGSTVVLVGGRTLLQRTTDDVVLAQVFAVQESASLAGWALGAAIAPALVRSFEPALSFVPLGLLVVLLAVLVTGPVRRLDAGSDLRTDELALLRQVPFLAVLPPYELERLARHTRWLDVPAGQVVVRQGDVGREFYVVAGGELAVAVDGSPRPALGAGDGFGEIALLHAVPRTATVEASTDARLLAVRAEDFLAAVTGSPDGRRLVGEVAGAHLARTAN